MINIWLGGNTTTRKGVRQLLKRATIPDTLSILDVGANKGQSIDFFLGINPKAKITAFEPNKKIQQEWYFGEQDQAQLGNQPVVGLLIVFSSS